MTWSKFSDEAGVCAKCRKAGNDAASFWNWSIQYSNREGTDGFLDESILHTVMPIPIAPERAKELAEKCADAWVKKGGAGLFERTDGGYIIHDFHDFQPPAEAEDERRERKSAIRREAGKRGASARWGRDGKTWQTDGKAMANASGANGKRMANGWQTDGKRMANAWQTDGPDPDPDPEDQISGDVVAAVADSKSARDEATTAASADVRPEVGEADAAESEPVASQNAFQSKLGPLARPEYESASCGQPAAKEPLSPNHAEIASAIRVFREFDCLNSDAVSGHIETERVGNGTPMELIKRAIAECAASVAGLGHAPHEVQRSLLGFCRSALRIERARKAKEAKAAGQSAQAALPYDRLEACRQKTPVLKKRAWNTPKPLSERMTKPEAQS